MENIMENIIAVFKSRNMAMQFASYFKRMGINAKTINTPRELSVSCGLSVIFNVKFLPQAKSLIEKYGYKNNVKLYVSGGDLYGKFRQIY